MLARLGIFFALMLAAGAIGLGGMNAASAEKSVTLSPSSGIVGTQVEAKLTGGTPGTFITVIFKIGGDPVLATGTVDANGEATFNFTIPWTPGGTYTIFFTDFKCACQIAVPFTVLVQRQTPTATATPTTPPTATPTAIATPPTAVPTDPPTATPTPVVPKLGTDAGGGSFGGPNVGVLGLGMLAVMTVVAWFAATRRTEPSLAVAAPSLFDDEPDSYSTELDLNSLEGMRRLRPFSATAATQRSDGRRGWAVGAGLAAATGAFLLLKRK